MPEKRSVPMTDLKAQYRRIQKDVDAAIARVVESTAFVRGADCGLFEKEFAAYCGVNGACGVANGTDALTVALKAYGVQQGDEVITVAHTFIATGGAILMNGARPVFVDVDPVSYTMDPEKLEQAITPRTKVIVPVHIYGHPADMTRILEVAGRRGLPVLEDAAQAHGAQWQGRRAGSLGHSACFSFYPGKNLGAYGDAGIVVSNDEEYLAKVRQIANHGGGANKYDNVVPGTNSRLDTLQAAVLRVKLPHLDTWNDERRACAALYSELLADAPGVGLPRETSGARSAWHLYTIRVKDRAALQAEMQKQGISTAIHYPRPLHLQPAMAVAGGKLGDLPVTEALVDEVVSLPLYPELPHATVREIASLVRAFIEAPATR